MIIVAPEDIEQLLTNIKHLNKSRFYLFLPSWLGTGLFTSSRTKWHNRLKILTSAFHFNILKEFVTVFNEETENLVKDLEKSSKITSEVDIVPFITQFTLFSIGKTALGVNFEGKNESYCRGICRIGELLVYRISRPWLYVDFLYFFSKTGREERKVVDILHKCSEKVIKEKNGQNLGENGAMLDLLLVYKKNGANISEEGIKEEVDTFMFEGHGTTAMAICYSLLLLANHKKIQDKFFSEIQQVLGDLSKTPSFADLQNLKFMEICLKECLRRFPSVPFISRISGEEIRTKAGYTIPENCNVCVSIYDLHRNPAIYPEPELFNPDRFLPKNVQKRHPFAYLPFSAGPRNCIGQKFALPTGNESGFVRDSEEVRAGTD